MFRRCAPTGRSAPGPRTVTEVRHRHEEASAPSPALADVVARALDVGLRRILMLAWRDLDDPEAGGSERHAHHVASLWADAGLDVALRTSAARGHPARLEGE